MTVVVGLVIALSGCADPNSATAGGQPASSSASPSGAASSVESSVDLSTAATSSTLTPVPSTTVLATTSPGTSAADRAHLIQIAEKSATVNGDPKPKSVQWVRAERGPIAKLLEFGLGDADNPKLSEYLILLTGKFTAYAASGPPGSKAPTGTYITLVVNPSWEVTDFGIGNQKIDLSSIGTVESR